MHPRNHWELVADPLGSAEHSLGTTGLNYGQAIGRVETLWAMLDTVFCMWMWTLRESDLFIIAAMVSATGHLVPVYTFLPV
jgi:hypothetical protein